MIARAEIGIRLNHLRVIICLPSMKNIFQVFRRTAPALRISLRCPAPLLGRGELLEGFPLRPDEPPRPARYDSDQPLAPNTLADATGRLLQIYVGPGNTVAVSIFRAAAIARVQAGAPSRRGPGYGRLAGVSIESQEPALAAKPEQPRKPGVAGPAARFAITAFACAGTTEFARPQGMHRSRLAASGKGRARRRWWQGPEIECNVH